MCQFKTIKEFFELKGPSAWTQGALARDINGRACEFMALSADGTICGSGADPSAVRWCISGACDVVYGEWFGQNKSYKAKWESLAHVIRAEFPQRVECASMSCAGDVIGIFNDHPETTFEDIMKVIELAVI